MTAGVPLAVADRPSSPAKPPTPQCNSGVRQKHTINTTKEQEHSRQKKKVKSWQTLVGSAHVASVVPWFGLSGETLRRANDILEMEPEK